MTNSSDLHPAAKTWDDPQETLEEVNARIHDGVPMDLLEARADGYATHILDMLWTPPLEGAHWMEIGSGTGYIMEGIDRALRKRNAAAASITGLDIAKNMLDRAKQRLTDHQPFHFQHYDGVTVPLPDASLDVVYSVAALQHIPKPFVYNLFLEANRLLRSGGQMVVHLLSFNHLAEQEKTVPWRAEIASQIRQNTGHWHHFYSREEIDNVLVHGSGFSFVKTWEKSGSLCASARKA